MVYAYDMRMHIPPEGWEVVTEPLELEDDVIVWVCARV